MKELDTDDENVRQKILTKVKILKTLHLLSGADATPVIWKDVRRK